MDLNQDPELMMETKHDVSLFKPNLFRLMAGFGSWRFGPVYSRLISSCLFLVISATSLAGESENQPEAAGPKSGDSWRFRVWLDDKEIGYHNFFLAKNGGIHQLHSEASFEYKLLFVKLYDYEHENRETWVGNCLQSIESVSYTHLTLPTTIPSCRSRWSPEH